MIDGVVREAIEQAIRFLQPGDVYRCEVNGHAMLVVQLHAGLNRGGYLVACESCDRLLQSDVRRAFLAIHEHTKLEEQKDLTDEK